MPVPVSEIHAYAEYVGIHDEDERRRLLRFVSAMDDEYLALLEKRRPKTN